MLLRLSVIYTRGQISLSQKRWGFLKGDLVNRIVLFFLYFLYKLYFVASFFNMQYYQFLTSQIRECFSVLVSVHSLLTNQILSFLLCVSPTFRLFCSCCSCYRPATKEKSRSLAPNACSTMQTLHPITLQTLWRWDASTSKLQVSHTLKNAFFNL